MATSGTVAQQLITVDTLITHALTRCGKLPSTVGGELLERVREALYFLIADLGNDGINLWCMTKSVVGVVPNHNNYQLPVATNDIPNCLYRTLRSLPGTVNQSVDAQTVDIGYPAPVDNVSGRFTAPGVATLAFEYSLDAVTWVTLMSLDPVEVIAGATFVVDLDNTAEARYWRIRDTSGTMLAMDKVRFRLIDNEVNMAKLNGDDYKNLPNKSTRGQRSLQYWFDKQIDPRIFVWPVSNQELDQIVYWAASQVQDPGELTNSLAVPTRWYRYIQAALSHMTAFLIPANELPSGRLAELKIDADECKLRASNGESDGSPWQIAPMIGGYTR